MAIVAPSAPAPATGDQENWIAGGWMHTFSNRQFYPLNPRPEDVDPYDIARGISMQCRYNGHVSKFYSVAEHCILIADAMESAGHPKEEVLWGLLHDATESYVGDMIRPLKRSMPEFSLAEDRVMDAILLRFDQPITAMPESVRDHDNAILLDERAALKGTAPGVWEDYGVEPLGVGIQGWSPAQAETEYLSRLGWLTGGKCFKAFGES